MYYIVGLGNPGEEYAKTRHNTGRIVLSYFLKKERMQSPVKSKKYASLISESEVEGENVLVLWPETYMNKSGSAVSKAVKSAKAAQKLVVVYDDMDLSLGTFKIAYGRGSGGHRGMESIIKALKTRDFIRIRVGISSATPTGKLKKPKGEKTRGASARPSEVSLKRSEQRYPEGVQRRYGEQKVLDFLMGDFKKPEQEALQKVSKKVAEAIETIIRDGFSCAMNMFN